MGSGPSQEEYEKAALAMYNTCIEYRNLQCFLPDVGIDESLLRYSGTDSNAALQTFSTEMLNKWPGYVTSMGSAIGALNSVPNAVGLGALVISMIIEIAVKSVSQPRDDTYSMLRRVFGEEKASSVEDTMSEYLRRHRMFMNNDQRLREEIRRLEQQLSYHLTSLRSSLEHDRQMSSRGFKIWVNGAAFHVQMLIHGARLDVQTGTPADYVNPIKTAIDLYMRELYRLLEKLKTHKSDSVFSKAYIDIVFSHYEPITGLKTYFLNVKNNVNTLIRQRGSFTVPSAAG